MIKKLAERVVLDNQFATIFNDDVEFPNGIKGTHLRVASKACGGVVVIPVMEDGPIAMLENFRYAVGVPVLEFPQGGINCNGETSSQAAIRELREETGLQVDKLTHIGRLQSAPSVMAASSDVYIAWGCHPSEETVAPDPFEVIVQIKNLNFEQAFKLLYEQGEIVDSGALAALSFLTRHFKASELQEISENGSAFMMGCFGAVSGMSDHANPFRNNVGRDQQYMDWLGGWNYARQQSMS